MNIAVILASGDGARLDYNNEKKCFIEVCNKPLFSYSMNTFLNHEEIDYIYLLVPKGYVLRAQKYIDDPKVFILEGGSCRQESVLKGLLAIKETFKDKNPFLLVHDGARPLISKELISAHLVMHKLNNEGIIYTSIKCHDSYVIQDGNKYIKHVDRSNLFIEQTPTCANLDLFLSAFDGSDLSSFNDDISLFASKGYKLNSVEGHITNFKVTELADLLLLKEIINK